VDCAVVDLSVVAVEATLGVSTFGLSLPASSPFLSVGY
jgi:hypothetical protein